MSTGASRILRRHGKAAAGILGVGQTFFADNAGALRNAEAHAALYTAQPPRTACKLCEAPLPAGPDFVKSGVPYASCCRCGHLNGLHEDTPAFCEAVYLDPAYGDYYASRDADAYAFRTRTIYAPKVEFLREALEGQGEALADLKVLDVGAGAGYFIDALGQAGVAQARGIELSPEMAGYGNAMLGAPRIERVGFAGTPDALRRTDADLVAMIGVLEHLRDPRGVLRLLRDETAVRHLFLVLPLFSFCVFLEMAFPASYPRHLVSDHTHLFTPQSIAHMEHEFGLARRAEWWFGSDLLDLYRHVRVTLQGNAGCSRMVEPWDGLMRSLIDPLQAQLDTRHLCSEVHLLLSFVRAGERALP